MAPADPDAPDRPARRRPATRMGRPTLTRERVGEAALDLAGREGFPAVTMRRLATELGVTVRALYRYVADRQDVVDLAAQRYTAGFPDHPPPGDDWRERLAGTCQAFRAYYRRYPRALTVALDEVVTPTGIDAKRITTTEGTLSFLCGIGLTLPDALAIRGQMLLDVFAFALLIDHRYDLAPAEARATIGQAVPTAWLDARPDLDVPLTRAAAAVDLGGPDAMFAQVVEHLVAAVEHRLRHPTPEADDG